MLKTFNDLRLFATVSYFCHLLGVYEVIHVSSNGCDSATEGVSAGGITRLIKVEKMVFICTIVSTGKKKVKKNETLLSGRVGCKQSGK